MDFLAIDANGFRGLDTQAHAVALNGNEANMNVSGNNDFLSKTARKNKHGSPPGKSG